MSFLVLFLMAIGKKINLSDRLILKETLNQESFSSVLNLLKRIFKYTLFFELIGATLLSTVFVPEFGLEKGIFYSIFHSISAFCNAGIDILGDNSLINYNDNIVLNVTIILLIIIGGLGFTVWKDLADGIRKKVKEKISFKKTLNELTLHTKIVLLTTLILLISGTIFIYILESNNITTMANNTCGEKLLKSVFLSTSLRTAGFRTIEQNEMTTVSKIISLCYMFIGGSPGSTAGGIKNVTMFIVILLVITYMKDRDKIHLFKKNIPESIVRRAVVVFILSIFLINVSTIALFLSESFVKEELLSSDIASIYTLSFMEIIYEVVSAITTVGISLGITQNLTIVGRIILILLMIIGRLRTSNYITFVI